MTALFQKLAIIFFISSCKGPYSPLDPSGDSSKLIADLFWVMLAVATIIWLLFVSLEIYAALVRPHPHERKKTSLLIIGGGTIFPTAIITISIYFSLRPLPALLKSAPPGSLQVEVSGLQWWWRVKYRGDEAVELANEIWLPVNEPVQFHLKSEDVIHSFWIPSLAGKVDMIPGRVNTLSFTPKKTGQLMGICAEYCGTSHALMRLNIKVVNRKQFDEWLNNQSLEAMPAQSEEAKKGKAAFIANGCTSCHSVRGISSVGKIGPDLTHVGSRKMLGSGIIANTADTLHRWITHAEEIKPGVKMPSFEKMSREERKALTLWLKGLK